MAASAPYQLHFLTSINDIKAEFWNNLNNQASPFLQHEFLLALEESKCVNANSGWKPYHAIIKAKKNENVDHSKIICIMPLYLKTNSMGEYVFDWSWADAYQQYGMAYYPKLLTAIPFTPSAGQRICTDPEYDQQEILSFLISELLQHAKQKNISSWHILFPNSDLSNQLRAEKIQQRIGCQYQWFNHNFNNFNDFLERFSSRKRKNIKKERSKVLASNITFEHLSGSEITVEQWQQFYLFYQSTYFVRGRQPYLNLDFFLKIGESMPDNLLLVMAIKDDRYIAGALSFKDNDTLYGRYWGCSEEYQFLHFETCYYQGIEYCIKHKLQRFDSGAQGEHKIQRGFEPVKTYSNHWIVDSQFSEAITRFLEQETPYIEDYIKSIDDTLPFKKN